MLSAGFLTRGEGNVRFKMYGIAMAFSGIPFSIGGAFAEKNLRGGRKENRIEEQDVCFR